MPVNLPPQYHKKESELKDAKTPEEKIAVLEELLAIMPKHKSSEKLQALLKSKIAKYRKAMEKEPQVSRRTAVPAVDREGAGQVVICGPVNSGKSSLLASLTKAKPEIGDYPFTTKVPLPGMMEYEDIKIQLVDTPPLADEVSENWTGDILRKADALLFVFDISSDFLVEEMESSLKALEKFGIMGEGGHLFNKEILWLANKAENPSCKDIKEIFIELYGRVIPEFQEISVKENLNTGRLPELIFKMLDIIRVYTKIPGKPADMENPYTLKRKTSVIELAEHVHKDLVKNFRYARLWRKGEEKVVIAGRDYQLDDMDIVEIHAG